MVAIKKVTTSRLSFYRTNHTFRRYVEFSSVAEFCEHKRWAKRNNVNFYILGNGSNTLFVRREVRTLVLKNCMKKYINPLDTTRVEVSSSVLILDLLRYCQKRSLDSFYYLASVPATIGGALAMNAGRGREHNLTIYDFVKTVTFVEGCEVKTLKNSEIERGYRETIFTGKNNCLILSAVFEFHTSTATDNPISSRRAWSKKHQDYTAPNCGSVFKESHPKILKRLKNLQIGKAQFSSKTYNWILNSSDSSVPIVILVRIAQFLHFSVRKKAVLEVIEVD